MFVKVLCGLAVGTLVDAWNCRVLEDLRISEVMSFSDLVFTLVCFGSVTETSIGLCDETIVSTGVCTVSNISPYFVVISGDIWVPIETSFDTVVADIDVVSVSCFVVSDTVVEVLQPSLNSTKKNISFEI